MASFLIDNINKAKEKWPVDKLKYKYFLYAFQLS